MSDIKWPKGRDHANLVKQIEKNKDIILNGTFIAVDPASITLGYAVAKKGEVKEQGTIALNSRAPINQRLQELVSTLQNDDEYGILAIERIRGTMAHAYLKFSVGAVMGGVKASVCIEVPIVSWKAFAGKDHKKSDDADAKAIAETLIQLAKEFEEE